MQILCVFIWFTLPAVRSNVFIPMLQIRELRFSEVKSLAPKYCYLPALLIEEAFQFRSVGFERQSCPHFTQSVFGRIQGVSSCETFSPWVLREWPLVKKDGSNPWELARNASFRLLPKVWWCRIPEGGTQTMQVIPMWALMWEHDLGPRPVPCWVLRHMAAATLWIPKKSHSTPPSNHHVLDPKEMVEGRVECGGSLELTASHSCYLVLATPGPSVDPH